MLRGLRTLSASAGNSLAVSKWFEIDISHLNSIFFDVMKEFYFIPQLLSEMISAIRPLIYLD